MGWSQFLKTYGPIHRNASKVMRCKFTAMRSEQILRSQRLQIPRRADYPPVLTIAWRRLAIAQPHFSQLNHCGAPFQYFHLKRAVSRSLGAVHVGGLLPPGSLVHRGSPL